MKSLEGHLLEKVFKSEAFIKTDQDEEYLVGHVLTEISSLLNHFLKDNRSNSIQVKVIVKRKRKVSFVVLSTYIGYTLYCFKKLKFHLTSIKITYSVLKEMEDLDREEVAQGEEVMMSMKTKIMSYVLKTNIQKCLIQMMRAMTRVIILRKSKLLPKHVKN